MATLEINPQTLSGDGVSTAEFTDIPTAGILNEAVTDAKIADANVGPVTTITAAADPGLALGAGSQFCTVTSANADHIVILPAPVLGTVIRLKNGSTGYELRSSAPATVAINGGTGATAESAVGANVYLEVRCVSATAWLATAYSTDATESKLEAAA